MGVISAESCCFRAALGRTQVRLGLPGVPPVNMSLQALCGCCLRSAVFVFGLRLPLPEAGASTLDLRAAYGAFRKSRWTTLTLCAGRRTTRESGMRRRRNPRRRGRLRARALGIAPLSCPRSDAPISALISRAAPMRRPSGARAAREQRSSGARASKSRSRCSSHARRRGRARRPCAPHAAAAHRVAWRPPEPRRTAAAHGVDEP